jgi:hypothetical protein
MNVSDVKSMYVAVHNPSSLNLNSLEIAVPEEMNFKVEFYNTTTNLLAPVHAEKACFDDHLDSGKNITNCRLQMDVWTPA